MSVIALASLHSASAADRTTTVASETLGEITIIAPSTEPTLFVILVSDADGLTPLRLSQANQLVASGAAVALVDLNTFIAKQAASDDVDCHYVFGDFEDLTRAGERKLGMTTYIWPVIFGLGKGGTLAYLSLSQAPANTAAGAVSLGFDSQLATKLPLCPGAPNVDTKSGVHIYAPAKVLPGLWSWISPVAPSPELEQFVAAQPEARLEIVPGGEDALFQAATKAALDIGTAPLAPLADLPLIEVPAKEPRALAIFLSGDGGWRDIDKDIGEYLAAHHVSVVGVDSLRYFWRRKEAEAIAADLDRIVHHYRRKWQLQPTALLGYSFGADVLPFVWSKLTPQTSGSTVLIGLLGLEPTIALEVSVGGWLGMSSSDELDVRPFLATLPQEKVMCFYGSDEKTTGDAACVFPELGSATRIERPGGHHFDGNYEAVAEAMLERLGLTVSPAAIDR